LNLSFLLIAHFLSTYSLPTSEKHQELWKKLNNHFKSTPKYQNLSIPCVSEYDLEQTERRLGQIKLPDDIKNAVRIHNGRPTFGFGLNIRSPTTDLLPLDKWCPHELEDGCSELLSHVVEDDEVESELKEDLREHLKVYNGEESVKSKKFKEMKTEMLVIGEGMADYCEQYLLGLRTGTIYLQVLNIPEWIKIGTFADWVEMALKNETDEADDDDEQD
jgi:cell wall assembly regulator SMI1